MAWQNDIIAHLESAREIILKRSEIELGPVDFKRFMVQAWLYELQHLKLSVLEIFPKKDYE